MQRRTLLSAALVPIGAASGLYFLSSKTPPMTKTQDQFEVTKTEAEWKEILTPEQFKVLRQHGTERAGAVIWNVKSVSKIATLTILVRI